MRTGPTDYPQSIAGQLARAGQPSGDSMRLDLLKRLLAVPTCSRQEGQMVEFLVEHVRQRGAKHCGEITTDARNNVFIRKDRAEHYPCVAAHLDTVCPLRQIKIVQQDGILFGLDENGQRTGIGADDKAGVYICLELLERFDDIAVALFAAEEIGCVGADHAQAAWFDDIGYLVEFDCPGYDLVSYTASGVRLFANDGEFIKTAAPVLQAHRLTKWQRHPFSDVTALRQRFNFSCLNLSCGYHNWHRPDDYVVVAEVEAAAQAGEALIAALGCRSYPFTEDADKVSEPLFEVTGLQTT